MLAQKRRWLLGGLAHPHGALARPLKDEAPRVQPGNTVALVGDASAHWLSLPLGGLCRDRGAKLVVECLEPAAPAGYVDQLRNNIEKVRPDLVLVAQRWLPGWDVAQFVGAAGSLERPPTVAWVRHPGEDAEVRRWHLEARMPSFHSELLAIPLAPSGEPTALGYAAWAGAIWRWLK